jgi:hypothetical protein
VLRSVILVAYHIVAHQTSNFDTILCVLSVYPRPDLIG